MTPVFLDTESTGLSEEDRLIQVAYKRDHLLVNEFFSAPLPIKVSASAIHHITEKDVADKWPFHGSTIQDELIEILEDLPSFVMVAHNAPFDVGMLQKEGINPRNVICTRKLVAHLDENAELENHQLQYLRYYYGLDIKATAHDALGDILVLEQVFYKLKDLLHQKEVPEDIWARMIEISSKPTLIRRFTFGKHKGELLKDVDRSYLEWMLGQKLTEPEQNEDWIYSLQHYLR